MLRSLLTLADDVPGDTAECGVYRGAASWFICRHFAGSGRTHFAFDSFEGLSDPDAADGAYWAHGDLAMSAVDVAEGLKEIESLLPGMLAYMETSDPGMHTTDTVDFEVVLAGTVVLELDDGAEVTLQPGDTVVQNGTRHRWRNPGSEPARLAVFICGAHHDAIARPGSS